MKINFKVWQFQTKIFFNEKILIIIKKSEQNNIKNVKIRSSTVEKKNLRQKEHKNYFIYV